MKKIATLKKGTSGVKNSKITQFFKADSSKKLKTLADASKENDSYTISQNSHKRKTVLSEELEETKLCSANNVDAVSVVGSNSKKAKNHLSNKSMPVLKDNNEKMTQEKTDCYENILLEIDSNTNHEGDIISVDNTVRPRIDLKIDQSTISKHNDDVALVTNLKKESNYSTDSGIVKSLEVVSSTEDKHDPIACENNKFLESTNETEQIENSQLSNDLFDEDWELNEILSQNISGNINLDTIQRCVIISVARHPNELEITLKNTKNSVGKCFIQGIWSDTPLNPGDVISILAPKGSSGKNVVNNSSGLLVIKPDHLMSTTSVVGAVYCKRKAVLQERWRGIDSANVAMTIGVLIHELVQKALSQSIFVVELIKNEVKSLVASSTLMLYDAGITEGEAIKSMDTYVLPLAEFMQTYVAKKTNNSRVRGQWHGHINEVLDIEENVCCPELGLKGKIDATLDVTINDQKMVVPLELKSGKASMSAEHRGQLVLYGMMMSLAHERDPARDIQKGLLLYLRDKVELSEISCGYPERRDLMMLRNQLVKHLAKENNGSQFESVVDIEEASNILQQSLPEPISNENACSKCPYLTLCSIHLWHTDDPVESHQYPLKDLKDEALGHLSSEHIAYFRRWVALLKLEEIEQTSASPLHSLWTDSVEKRVERGTCISNLTLHSVESFGDRWLHVFKRKADLKENEKPSSLLEGDFSIVSVDRRPWIAAGVIKLLAEEGIHISLERNLSLRYNNNTKFHIDSYESYASTVQNLTNLGVLMENNERSGNLRRLIIDKEPARFEAKLPREVGRHGTTSLRHLNVAQQRAVLKCIAAKDYALLQGLPGTGKTQTVCVLIEMLVKLKQRVLVTAHTHSAVDTVLARLPESMRVMRLGSAGRVAARVSHRCEEFMTSQCRSSTDLAALYDSMEVVGVTCIGAGHPLLARTTFDVCIVDEATQVLQTTVLRALFSAKRFVLVGDPQQLPPVIKSRHARRLGMEESLFHRLMNEDATCVLALQYRMNRTLTKVANKVAYGDRLKCANEDIAEATLKIDIQKIANANVQDLWISKVCSPELENAAMFLNLDIGNVDENQTHEIKGCTNLQEVCLAYVLITAFIEGGIKASDIGVIAPYRDQVMLLRENISNTNIDISTVDQFQGKDKSVIIYSCTKWHAGHKAKTPKESEILNDQRRLAVSVTRAKHKLVVLGHYNALIKYATLQKLIESCKHITVDKETILRLMNKHNICTT